MEHQTPVNSTIDETKTSFNLAPGAYVASKQLLYMDTILSEYFVTNQLLLRKF